MTYEEMLIFKKRIDEVYDRLLIAVLSKDTLNMENIALEVHFIQEELKSLTLVNLHDFKSIEFFKCLSSYGMAKTDLIESEIKIILANTEELV